MFKVSTGKTPHRYIVERRVEVAKQLLDAGELPLLDVARRSGFATQSHFTGVFHKQVGLTPGGYRNSRSDPGHYSKTLAARGNESSPG